jgi:hypothetical protein
MGTFGYLPKDRSWRFNFRIASHPTRTDPISGELRASLLRWQGLDIRLCDTAGIATDGRLVYGKR